MLLNYFQVFIFPLEQIDVRHAELLNFFQSAKPIFPEANYSLFFNQKIIFIVLIPNMLFPLTT
jgi:hypothetical protein